MPPRSRFPVLLLAGALAVSAIACAALYVALPDRAVVLDSRAWRRHLPATELRGAFHVHTRRSDGSGSLDEVAAAASRAGLDFVIVTDHGNGSRPPETPQYRSGVLMMDAVEISTTGGHYVALGLPVTPYPLAGEPRDVVEDVRRLGGLGIVAHPDSAKRSLVWRDWGLEVDGFEWLNADSEWRDESREQLLTTLLQYPWRPAESVVALFDRPEVTLRRWDEAGARGRRWVALPGLDAHARFGWQGLPDEGDEGPEGDDSGFSLAVPSYESMFRSMTARVEVDRASTGDARGDAEAVLRAIRGGRVYSVLDGAARGGRVEFFAETPAGLTRMGEWQPASDATVRFHAQALAPAGSRLVLRRNGEVVAASSGLTLTHDAVLRATERAAYRVEVEWPKALPAPWIVTNAIGFQPGRGSSPHASTDVSTAQGGETHSRAALIGGWRAEKDPASEARFEPLPDGLGLDFRFSLAGSVRDTWAAIAGSLPLAIGPDDEVRFSAEASRPMRLSVQVRAPGGEDGQRWRRSVYIDETRREVVLPFSEFTPVGREPPAARLSQCDALLFVVDRTHAVAGSAGRVTLEGIRVVRDSRSVPARRP